MTSRSDSRLTLVRAPGSVALVDEVDVELFATTSAAYTAFAGGQVDWSRVPPDDIETATAKYGQAAFRPYVADLFYGFNLKNPIFADRRFRQAIVRAVDRDAIINTIYHRTVLPLDGVVVRGVPGYHDGACGTLCRHDPALARQLLAAVFPAGGPAPPPVVIDFDDDPTQQAVAKAIQANLADVGITATLHPQPLAAYQQYTASSQIQLFHLGWIGAYPSADAFLAPLFVTGSASNVTRLAVPAVDAAIAAARAEPDPAARAQHYADAEQAVMQELPVVPIAQYETPAVIADRVRGLRPTTTGGFDAAQVWLAGP
jgi:ABC-type transport system substrate-binding protein